ncbi:MAG: hypothetical protein U0414_07920 [Polyangiaceae bacterium]
MISDGLPKDVVSLLRDRLHGLEALDALRCLHGEARVFAVAEIAERIDRERDVARGALEELAEAELVVREGKHFRYAPRDAATRATVDRLMEVYVSARIEVMRLMTENALERLRSSAVLAFPHAFRSRKRPPE